MGALQGLLEAAEWAAIRATDSAPDVAPALKHLVGPAMEAEKPGLELSRRLAMEELLNAKQAAKSARESLLPDWRMMSHKDKVAYDYEHGEAAVEKLKQIAADKQHDELMKGWTPEQIKAAGWKKKPKHESAQDELKSLGWTQDQIDGIDINNMQKDYLKDFIKKWEKSRGGSFWQNLTPEKKSNLYRKSGMAKIMSFHESQPEKLSQLLSAAEEAGRGVEGGVEPTLALPSVAHQSAERVAKEGKLPDNFGNTALIFGPESVKPGLKGVDTFDADAYLYRRPKNFEKTREGQEVSWIGKKGRKDAAYKEDPNLLELNVTRRNPKTIGKIPGKDFMPGAENQHLSVVYELPKDIDRGMVIDAFKLGPDDYAKNVAETYPGGSTQAAHQVAFRPEMMNTYVKPFSTEDAENYSLAQLWDERTKKNAWVKLPRKEEDLATYGFVPSKKETTSFPDMEHREGGRWIPTNDPEAMRQHIKESAGDLRFTESLQHGISNPIVFSGARAKYATEIKSEKQLRASLGSFKHQKIPFEQRRKLEDASDEFFKRFRSEGSQEAIKNTPPEQSFEAFTSDKAHEYLSKLEKEGTGGNPTLDKLGLQYLAFMKSVPSDYYEAKIFRHVPIKEAKALYMPSHLADEGHIFLEDVERLKKNHGLSEEDAITQALDTTRNYSGRHAAVLLQAMKKRGIPVVTDIGDLLKHAWVVPVIGPGAAYIAGDKSSQKK